MAGASPVEPGTTAALDEVATLFDGAVAAPPETPSGAATQTSLDELGRALSEVTFCIVDVETTGGSAAEGGLTEIGAVKLRGGECLGTFSTLVNPGMAIPRQITVLTGITQAMVLPAPRVDEVLASLLEFLGDAVVVGHNISYDLRFLNAALERSGRDRLANRSVDTVALARRLVRDEVGNCRLGTLAERFGLAHQPSHRALDDALATGDLLHVLLERAAGFGVLGLDDLLTLPTMAGHPQAGKLRLTDHLPRRPGVYAFRDGRGEVLYVGRAANLRARVRSYFSGDDRRKVGQLLRETATVDHRVCANTLEAAVAEVRLIHRHLPRFNRQAKRWRSYAYVKVTNEAFPRLSVVRTVRDDGAWYLGPLSSTKAARRVTEALWASVPIRRCVGTPGRRSARCAAAQIGAALCPCDGTLTEEEYRRVLERLHHGLRADPDLLLSPLTERMAELAGAERFEEAAETRDRGAALASALARQRRFDGLRTAGWTELETDDGAGAELDAGRLVAAWGPGGRATLALGEDAAPPSAANGVPPAEPTSDANDSAERPRRKREILAGAAPELLNPVAREDADELACVGAWIEANAGRLRVRHSDGGLAEALPRLPELSPRR